MVSIYNFNKQFMNNLGEVYIIFLAFILFDIFLVHFARQPSDCWLIDSDLMQENLKQKKKKPIKFKR